MAIAEAVGERNSKRSSRTQLSLYIPKYVREMQLIERLEALARRQRRSLNFLVIEAIVRYLEGEGKEDED